ncbi:MAG: hypothetical protein HYY32_05330 [Chloroflexi bacterium]|nr:hypothetical protein [Chloroflexota bacterium]
MSACTADGLALEKMGVPAAVVGNSKLVDTTGKATARAHGLPEYPFVCLNGEQMMMFSREEMLQSVEEAVPQVESILLQGPAPAP